MIKRCPSCESNMMRWPTGSDRGDQTRYIPDLLHLCLSPTRVTLVSATYRLTFSGRAVKGLGVFCQLGRCIGDSKIIN